MTGSHSMRLSIYLKYTQLGLNFWVQLWGCCSTNMSPVLFDFSSQWSPRSTTLCLMLDASKANATRIIFMGLSFLSMSALHFLISIRFHKINGQLFKMQTTALLVLIRQNGKCHSNSTFDWHSAPSWNDLKFSFHICYSKGQTMFYQRPFLDNNV